MRILMLSQWFQPEPIFKGLPLARAWKDRGHQVEVLTGFPNYPGGRLYEGYRVRPWQREWMDGILVNRVALYPSHDQSTLRRMVNYLSFGASASLLGPWLVHKPDIVYVYNLVTLTPTARFLRLFKRSRIVLDVQDIWPESVTSSGMMKPRGLYPVLKACSDWGYRSFDRLIVLSPGFKEALGRRGVPPEKIDVVYNWCNEAELTIPQPNAAVADCWGFAGKFNVVFAGTMGSVQALDCVIEAARRLQNSLPDVKFTFVGGGVDVERLQTESVGLKNVQFLPRQSPEVIGEVLANADVLLVHLKSDPLFSITIPSKIQAYLYAGRPILCGVAGDAAELIERSGAGRTFAPEDPESLCSVVCELRAMDVSALRKMGQRGRRFYCDHLSFQKGIGQIEDVFQRALQG